MLGGIAVNAMADDNSNNIYINANTGIATMSSLPTGSWMGSINAGFNIVPKYFGVEAGYNIITGNQFQNAQATTNIFDVAVKGTLPLTDTFGIYGRAGLGYGISGWTGQAQGANNLCNCNYDSNFGTYLVGAGVTFKVSEHFDLRLEDYAFLPFNNNTMIGSTNIVAFGTQYNF